MTAGRGRQRGGRPTAGPAPESPRGEQAQGREDLAHHGRVLHAALVSPPEGLNLYIIQGIRKAVSEDTGLKVGTVLDLWIGVLPFMVGMAICIAFLLFFPGIALWLPNLVMGK